MTPIHQAERQYIDINSLPEEFHQPVTDYMRGILTNEELESLRGRWLLRIQFVDEADDTTPADIVQQLADGVIGFDEYPFDGIDWPMLNCEPPAYAGYLQAVRYLRTQLPAEVIEEDQLHLLV